ncbi:MAG TPA: hypothetical protein VHR66_09790 [Gemmataceae bacterium]|jgi:hypothetical protein|nr:hypothetical protein [Gemmataceae bacterium]
MTALRFGLVAVLALATSLGAFAKEPDKFVVHEWGTFSTFSGSDGKSLKFYPDDRSLPEFVYSRHRNVKGGVEAALVSLETPVLYFYSDRDRKVSVSVDFPKGMMTEWYPNASRPPEKNIRWDDLQVLAKEQPTLPTDRIKDRYLAARETDAQIVRTEGEKTQYEKFLFYRGVGDFQMPFVVKATGDGKFTVKNTGKHAIPGYVLVNVHDRKVTFQAFGHLSPAAEEKIALPAEASTADKLGDTMAELLVKQGLYEKEARAMVKTWRSDWFGDEGTRVLYLVAESVTDEFLPIKIDPKPDQMLRVLVGRHDVLTPEREKDIDALVKRVNGPSNDDAKAADAVLHKLGRYRWPAQTAAQERLKGRAGTRTERQ